MAFIVSDVCVFDAGGAYLRTVRQIIPIDCNGVAGAPTSYIDGAQITATAPVLPAGHTFGSCSRVDSSNDFVYLFGGQAAPGSTSPDGTSGYAPQLVTPVISLPFTGTVATPMTPGTTLSALSPVQTITNPSTTRHMRVQMEYTDAIYLTGHSWPSTNEPVVFHWELEQSVNGAPFVLVSNNFTTVPPGWFVTSPSLTRTSSLYLDPGQTITLQVRGTLSHDSGQIDNISGGAYYQVVVEAFGQLV